MDSEERPFSMHDMEERQCAYCGDFFMPLTAYSNIAQISSVKWNTASTNRKK